MATITVTADTLTATVTVTQTGTAPVLEVTQTRIDTTAIAFSYTVNVTNNTAWTAASNAEWCKLSNASATGSGAFTISADRNTEPKIRTATITVTDGTMSVTVTVTQAGSEQVVEDPVLEVDKMRIDTTAVAFSYTVNVTNNTAWTAASNAEWCKLSNASATGNGAFTVSVTENLATEPRTATITLTADTMSVIIPVTQAAASVPQERNTVTITFDCANSREITFQMSTQKCIVDWGDGKVNEYTNLFFASVSHTYAVSGGTQTVRIQEEGLTRLDFLSSKLIAMDLSDCTHLQYLKCPNTQLTFLNVSGCTALQELDCDRQQR
jgi:hypothetical protein